MTDSSRPPRLVPASRATWLGVFGAVALGVVGLLLGSARGPLPPPALVATSFTLLDAQGADRLALVVDGGDDSTAMRLLGADGEARLSLQADHIDPRGAGFTLGAPEGATIWLLAQQPAAGLQLEAPADGPRLKVQSFEAESFERPGEDEAGGVVLAEPGGVEGASDLAAFPAFREPGGVALGLYDPPNPKKLIEVSGRSKTKAN